jgi:Na+-transporting NADH:ubiquinone oxidoreductase subunit C
MIWLYEIESGDTLVKDSVRTLVFATVLGIVCSLLLAAINLYTAPLRRANEEAEEVQNILSVLQVHVDPDWDSKTLLAEFEKSVRIQELGDLTLYENISDPSNPGKPIVVAVDFSGPGLWGPIKGVMSLEPDLLTIQGISFYQQEETPGLGGEIGSEWFQKQFAGKEIVSLDGIPGFKILKPGSTTDKNSVDGITGATMTSERAQTIIDDLAKEIWKERSSYVQ